MSPAEQQMKTIEIDDLKPQVGILQSGATAISHNQKQQFKTSQPAGNGAAVDALKKANATLQAKAKKYKGERDALARLLQ